jgi:hypothetical protein
LKTSPTQYYQDIQPRDVIATIKRPCATIADIKRELGIAGARAIIVIALIDVVKSLNISRNMNDVQVAKTADLIIREYWYYTIPEVKDCLQNAILNEQLYERLDVNIVMKWFKDYDIKRDEKIIGYREQEKSKLENETKEPIIENGGFETYRQRVEAKAAEGDPQAIRDLENIQTVMASSSLSPEAQRRKEIEYRIFKANYDKSKKYQGG